jgi:serine/threonine protein kinase
MAELSIGTQVRFRNNTTCTIKKELGRGGQGIVYLVDYNGKDYALKWYIIEYGSAFYDNLERNVKLFTDGKVPTHSFLWPEAITERQFGSFGYLMKLRPQGYEEVGAFLLAQAKFASVNAMLEACLEICDAFQKLHALGYVYQDMNDGNFFINPQTGHVLICDNDNVSPVNMGIAGKSGYMAPEIVEKESMPNRYTDYFSQSVILFLIFFLNRPFEGARSISCPCMNESADRVLNGKSCVFIMDPKDRSNAPVKGLHTNVIRRWPYAPKILQNAFIETFSHEAIITPAKRIMDYKWKELFTQVRSQYIICPHCGKKTFVEPLQNCTCSECGKVINRPATLKVGHYNIPIVPGQQIYQSQVSEVSSPDDYKKVAATVVRNPKNPNLWGIRNESGVQWTVTIPNGEVKLVGNGNAMPASPGLKIRFSRDGNGEII